MIEPIGDSERIIIVANRLSVSASITENAVEFSQSMGGLATGLSSLQEYYQMLWVGWCGIPREEMSDEQHALIEQRLKDEYRSIAVDLTQEEVQQFYLGFCNNTIWPLFHYFPTYVDYSHENFATYERVNQAYFERLRPHIRPDDIIWVHDYQLMLLPQYIRDEFPDVRIGFFLHIPFPSYEMFRLLPWRRELMDGVLGADLVGFHTYDYARHFLSAVRRIVGLDNHLGRIALEGRTIGVDVFPMGIDYERYAKASQQPEVMEFIDKIDGSLDEQHLILSVDRLDYSKGIPNRLWGYRYFLEQHPEWHGRVSLAMIVAPSREGVPQYQDLKREVDELISDINGTFSTLDWVPIIYFYRGFPFSELSAMYHKADVLLVTPLRDGMNLVAKEYAAAKVDGVVILSETAGAARELGEPLVVNPTNLPEIGDAIFTALTMPRKDRERRNSIMHRRLQRYDIRMWAQDFIEKLRELSDNRSGSGAQPLNATHRRELMTSFFKAQKRMLLLDYDGTLVGQRDIPEETAADQSLRSLIERLAGLANTEVVIISGRDREYLEALWGDLPVGLIAGHGVWQRDIGGEWAAAEILDVSWKEVILPIMQRYQDRTPGAFIEEKAFSIKWHYHRSEPELSTIRLSELRDVLIGLTANLNVAIMDGNKVLEVKNSNVNKGRGASRYLMGKEFDFILAIGDDHTDEEMFAMLPQEVCTVKVGRNQTSARYFVSEPKQVRSLLRAMLTEESPSRE